jgi:predicted RecB family nuclease
MDGAWPRIFRRLSGARSPVLARLTSVRITGGQLRLAASDVANFLACQQLTRLDLLKARGARRAPREFDLGFQDLVQRGEEHERAVLDRFRADGLTVAEISPTVGAAADADAARATVAAIETGADLIYQGTLAKTGTGAGTGAGARVGAGGEPGGGPGLFGRPDFLIRADLLAAPDGGARPEGRHYEIVDAKLARTAKARAVLQTAFYSHLLAGLQGTAPRWMHLALGGGEFASFKVNDFAAYERQTRARLESVIGAEVPADPYPEPVEHCAICRWSDECGGRRRRDDDLSLVAGMTIGQRRALKAAGIATRREFAGLADLPELSRVSQSSLARSRLQARLQVASDDGPIQYELLPPERDTTGAMIANRGLLALPEPAEGDLFFDIEGARYYCEDAKEFGLQYLFGVVDTADRDPAGRARYTQIWSFDRSGEKRAFEELIDFITERRARHPGMHVYHYNHYEPTSVDHLTELHGTRQEAVGTLMGRFATREDEVDDLFRGGVFVDLYRVVRQGLRAGVESYSIKRLEPLCGYQRQVDLKEATINLIGFEAALEDGTAAADRGRQAVVAGYNEDDCRATLALRDWLEERRVELARTLGLTGDLPRPAVIEEPAKLEDPEIARIRAALLAGVPESGRTQEQQARALLADLLEWHRRQDKPAWWRYFYLRELSSAELIGEPDALGALTGFGGVPGGEVMEQVDRSVVRRFSFPSQEHKFSAGDTAFDPVSGRGWPVWRVNDQAGTIDLKVGRGYSGPWPGSLVEGGPVDAKVLAGRLRDLGARVAADGLDGVAGLDGLDGGGAATALLMRRRPAADADRAGPLTREGETVPSAALRLTGALQGSYLPIQGPPGTGKTFNAADQILALIAAGRSVGITGPSHSVICHVIDGVSQHAARSGVMPRIGQRADKDSPFLSSGAVSMSNGQLEQALQDRELDVAGGTVWLWARPQLQGSVDTLFVDEAGQLSLANVLAVAGAARNLVLLGDPQQLAQPSQATQPPGAGASALEHILGDRATMPAAAGLLLDQTYRMHPELCRFTSEVFYDGKLHGVAGLDRQEILGEGSLRGAGLRIVEVPHQGNANSSPEEAHKVAELVGALAGRWWRDKDGNERPIGAADVLIVTPYNAQIREIRNALEASGHGGFKVGTVDKFQGREGAVVIYSMATSWADEAPRGLEFLYDTHRLNVATSRARAMAIIVASPDLIRVSCRTPPQMVLANALCRAWESGR